MHPYNPAIDIVTDFMHAKLFDRANLGGNKAWVSESSKHTIHPVRIDDEYVFMVRDELGTMIGFLNF